MNLKCFAALSKVLSYFQKIDALSIFNDCYEQLCSSSASKCDIVRRYRQECSAEGIKTSYSLEKCQDIVTPTPSVPAPITTFPTEGSIVSDMCLENTTYQLEVTAFCQELMFTPRAMNSLCSQVLCCIFFFLIMDGFSNFPSKLLTISLSKVKLIFRISRLQKSSTTA